MLTDIIPAAWRARLYFAFLVVSGTLGALSVAFKTLEMPQPTWLTVSLTVLAFIATSVAALAKANVPVPPVTPATPAPVPTIVSAAKNANGSITSTWSNGTQSTEPGA